MDKLGKLFHNPIFEHIKNYFDHYSSEESTIFVFVPYIKTETLSRLLKDINCKIIIITTWKPRDIQFGSSELDIYPFCRERGISLYIINNLHLKIYSVDLQSAILSTANISQRGLLPNGNYESGTLIKQLGVEDRIFFENIRKNARLVDDTMYAELEEWINKNKKKPEAEVELDDIISKPKKDNFAISALPMTHSIDDLIEGYTRVSAGECPSNDSEIAACIFHDLTNYEIDLGKDPETFVQLLKPAFFGHPFIQIINEFIAPEAYFGRIKEWIQNNCTDVPVPSRRDLVGNVQVLLEWFVELGDGKYAVDVPGRHSQRIYKI